MVTDLTYLKNMSGGDIAIIKEMIGIFNEQVEEYIIEMPKLLEDKNYFSLGKLAHKAKSSVSIMGMHSLGADLKTLELLTKDNLNTESYSTFVDTFVHQCKEAMKELNEIALEL